MTPDISLKILRLNSHIVAKAGREAMADLMRQCADKWEADMKRLESARASINELAAALRESVDAREGITCLESLAECRACRYWSLHAQCPGAEAMMVLARYEEER